LTWPYAAVVVLNRRSAPASVVANDGSSTAGLIASARIAANHALYRSSPSANAFSALRATSSWVSSRGNAARSFAR
jgi:hypothetical protein